MKVIPKKQKTSKKINEEFESVPAKALTFSLGEFEMVDQGDETTSAPVQMVALGGKVLDHWWFGPVIQDLSGMKHRSRIAIDYLHNPGEILGYINKFKVENNKLLLGGTIISRNESDRASEVMTLGKAGVPYEASIEFSPRKPGELKAERIPEGETTKVNGKTFKGPLTVFREWPLIGVAVVPHGADGDTSTKFSKGDNEQCKIQYVQTQEDSSMKDDETTVEGAAEEKQATPEVKKGVEAETEQAAVEAEPKTQQATKPEATDARGEFKQFVEKFGPEKAAEYYAAGHSLAEAMEMYVAEIGRENKELKAAKEQLAAAPSDEGASAAPFDGTDNEEVKPSVAAGKAAYAKSIGMLPEELEEEQSGIKEGAKKRIRRSYIG